MCVSWLSCRVKRMLSGTAYFYIDDVSVERITNTPTVVGQLWTDDETIVLEKKLSIEQHSIRV
jgi:hypothetical protein